MNCDEALLAMSAALDGELSRTGRRKLSRHLMSCPDCRALAEDLRVLTDELGRSDREVPPSLAESVRRAIEEPPASPVPKRHPPYLKAVAAMLALCVGLGGIGLFASRQMNGDSAEGIAPALFEAPQDAAADGEPALMAESAAQSPMAESAAAPEEDGSSKEVRAGNSSGDSQDSGGYALAPSAAASLTPEEALELVFLHLGGRGTYPNAALLAQDGSTVYYLQTVETDQVTSDYYLDYYGLYEDGVSQWFRFYEDVSEKQADVPGHEVTLNWYTVAPDGLVTAEFAEN